ncbi:uroporphyrinogen-III C-methyltransferase [Archaeoglobales archaeon]|nr:MAG: uroporphyrinogen-III C-methyltransferase [Archaeoglobales archaeon]
MVKVYIVGAGPGDAELLTIKALKAIEKADVVLYDRLIGEDVISMIKNMGKELVYVGKENYEKGDERQEEINRLIKRYVDDGKVVVRLKGGDPFVFGRGGMEAEFLSKHNIPFEVIPGLSSVNAVPTSAGIPLTHPNLSSSILVVTGKEDVKNFCSNFNGTIVILMGKDALKNICKSLMEIGKKSTTPVAIIEDGTLKSQRVIVGELCNIAETIEREGVKGTVLIVVGEVVRLFDVIGRKR